MIPRLISHCLVVFGLLITTTNSSAAPVTFAGNGFLGDFTGSLDYNSTTHTITVTLTNASSTLPGGMITGFAFNLPNQPGNVTGVTYTAQGPHGTLFSLLGGPSFSNSVNVAPYGDADIGAALDGDWLGGGNPNQGLAIGQTGTYTFQLTGNATYLNALTAQAIFDTQTNGGGEAANFLVRFRGFDNGGSDKVPAVEGDTIPPESGGSPEIPEPATIAVLGAMAGLGALGYRVRRKNRARE